jgi:uncharacterized coiled-coil protein SlyX
MAKTTDERLNDLEAKSVFQEDTIERLSNELRKQQQELIFLKEELKSLKENIHNGSFTDKDEKPPHY